MNVFVLRFGDEIIGVYADREGAEKMIVSAALSGRTIHNADISEHYLSVNGSWRNPLTVPGVRAQIQAGQKIAAIKLYREAVPGMGLREAKDAIEKVWTPPPPEGWAAECPDCNEVHAF